MQSDIKKQLPKVLTQDLRIPHILDERGVEIYLLEQELRAAQAETDAEIEKLIRRVKWGI